MLINSDFILKAVENPRKDEKDQDRKQGNCCSFPIGWSNSETKKQRMDKDGEGGR